MQDGLQGLDNQCLALRTLQGVELGWRQGCVHGKVILAPSVMQRAPIDLP